MSQLWDQDQGSIGVGRGEIEEEQVKVVPPSLRGDKNEHAQSLSWLGKIQEPVIFRMQMPGVRENKGDLLRRVRKGALLPRLPTENRFHEVHVFGIGKIDLRRNP